MSTTIEIQGPMVVLRYDSPETERSVQSVVRLVQEALMSRALVAQVEINTEMVAQRRRVRVDVI
jgi:hypothetical protein